MLSEFYNVKRYKRLDFIQYDFDNNNMVIDFIKNNCAYLESDKIWLGYNILDRNFKVM